MAVSTLSVKHLKDQEKLLQIKLYENLTLLKNFYAPSKELKQLFKPSMFEKTSQETFQEVTYYLFSIVEPELVKEKVTWPIYEKKLEANFRKQVIDFINFLGTKYEYDCPNLMPSQLVTPKAYKVLKMLFKLSTLVMHEHLKKDVKIASMLLAPPKSHKRPEITQLIIKNIKTATAGIEKQTAKMSEDFHEDHQAAIQEAEQVLQDQEQSKRDFGRIKSELDEKKKNLPETNMESLSQKLEEVKSKMSLLMKMKTMCEQGTELLSCISSDEALLEFKKDDFVPPPSVAHFFNAKELNLHELFQSLTVYLDQLKFELPTLSSMDLEELTRIFEEMGAQCSMMDEKLTSHLKELEDFSKEDVPTITITQHQNESRVIY